MTKSEQSITMHTTIVQAQRLNNSPSGNPRWKLHTAFGSFLTAVDADCNYTSFDTWADDRVPVELTLSPDGRVTHAERRGQG